MKQQKIIDFLTLNDDTQRLDSYLKYDTMNEETLINLIDEYNISLNIETELNCVKSEDDKQLEDSLLTVINYLFDCYNG